MQAPATLWPLAALNDPEIASQWTLPQWEQAIRYTRRLRLLARLGHALQRAGLLGSVPEPARRHVSAEMQLSQWRCAALAWAVERAGSVLSDMPRVGVLLKGAAYLGQDLDVGAGRLPSDADVLVPASQLAEVQGRLRQLGWEEVDLDPHDQRYYHEWSHEVPPMRHPLHAIELDLHHNIVPPVARTKVDAALLFERLQPAIWPPWQVLHPVDQVLHSAVHLFYDSELRDRVRDLIDLDGLMRHFGRQPAFWDELPARAAQLDLGEPLALAIDFCTRWLATPVPPATQRAIARWQPGLLRRAWLMPALTSVLTPTAPDQRPPLTQQLAATVLLTRHHLWRMPLRLLVPHLWHKLQRKRTGDGVTGTASS